MQGKPLRGTEKSKARDKGPVCNTMWLRGTITAHFRAGLHLVGEGWRNVAADANRLVDTRGRRMEWPPPGRTNRMLEETADRPATGTDAQAATNLVRPVSEALGNGDEPRTRELAQGLAAPDLADLIELLEPEARIKFVRALGEAFPFEVLSELDETVRDQLSRELPKELLARAVAALETDDAAYLIQDL